MLRANFILMFLCFSLIVQAQNDEFRKAFDDFQKRARADYEDFRSQANHQYVEFLKEAWAHYKELPAIPKPKEKELPPVVIDDDKQKEPIEDRPIPIEEPIAPLEPEPQPVPIAPIIEQPQPEEEWVSFVFYGTDMRVRFSDEQRFTLTDCSESNVADAWLFMSSDAYNNTIRDCLELRITKQLSDWAYFKMLNTMAESCFGKGNEAMLLLAFIYCQSGYQMRLAFADNQLRMLFSSKHYIYDKPPFKIGDDFYYLFGGDEHELIACNVGFPKEKQMSLLINKPHQFTVNNSELRTIVSKRFPDMNVKTNVNKNLMSFYNDYPTSMIDGIFMTRWAIYANSPMDADVKKQLYPQLQKAISGKSKFEAVRMLLNWVQTGFVYGYDDKVWGGDRAFFAEETLYYPFCDCEDRSILLSRLVRDLVGLKVVLVYYPGHLATAIKFDENVTGDHIMLGNDKFVICDPTYINASVGMTMPNMNNSKAQVILLE